MPDVYFFKSCSKPIILLNVNWDLQEPAHCLLLEVLPKPPTWEHGARAVHPLRGPHPCSLQDPTYTQSGSSFRLNTKQISLGLFFTLLFCISC